METDRSNESRALPDGRPAPDTIGGTPPEGPSAPAPTAPPLVVVIPANDESAWIEACLAALAAQDAAAGPLEVVVSANACTDDTAARARGMAPAFAARGGGLRVIDSPAPGKTAALDRAEAALAGRLRAAPRVYLDADVRCDAALMGQLRAALDTAAPRYATGTLAIAPARSAATRAYARVWARTPFVRGGAVGAGLFAVNAAGRARWGDFPDIISDDTFVRLNFAPHERVEVPARYHWPMVEGLGALVRVRRRQDTGVRQIAARWPGLMGNEGKGRWPRADLARLALADPLGVAAYGWVHLATRLRRSDAWSRGR